IGSGPHIEDGSPARHAGRISAPVLLFHGMKDEAVRSRHSMTMATNLEKAGRRVERVIWEELDHYLDDSDARTQLLLDSDRFFDRAFSSPR
ncbi:MAG: alpha/beta hydrolase family protein, partial [Gammaproteobacteria bacterium]